LPDFPALPVAPELGPPGPASATTSIQQREKATSRCGWFRATIWQRLSNRKPRHANRFWTAPPCH